MKKNYKFASISLVVLISLLCGCTSNEELNKAKEEIRKLKDELATEKVLTEKAKLCLTEQQTSKEVIKEPKKETVKAEVEKSTESEPNSQWMYQNKTDEMTSAVTYFAHLQSSNQVTFDFPYNGPQYGNLTIRSSKRHGNDVIFQIEKGQLLCNSYDGCNILVRFDDEKPITFSAIGPDDNSTEVIFIRNYSKFMSKLVKSKSVKISVTVHQEGSQIFEFNTSGFSEKKFRNKG